MPQLEIGKIVNTHGLNGLIKVEPWCDGIETFEYLDSIYIADVLYKIESVKIHKNLFLVKLSGVDNLNFAESLKGKIIKADRDMLPPLEDGTYYLSDIMGIDVFEGDTKIGVVYDWIETGSKNVYVIKRDNKKDLLLPAVDEFIRKIDIPNKKMIVKLMEGLVQDEN